MNLRLPVCAALLLTVALAAGCSQSSPTVKPENAVPVPADAPVGEETPATDEK